MDQQLIEIFEAPRAAMIYGPADILLNMAMAFLLSLMISYIYRRTHKGLSYSQSFVVTIILVGVVVAMVMMVIGNNLARAFALVGALSIIRFRTVVKDTKDTAYVFFALAAGMAAGTSNHFLGIAGTLMLSAIALMLHWTNYGSLYKNEFILSFRAKRRTDGSLPAYSDAMAPFVKSSNILHTETSGDGQSTKLTFDISMKKDVDPNDLTRGVAALDDVSEVRLIVSRNDVDY